MTIAFTVYFIPAGEEEFADGSIYKVQDNGVLTTTTPDGRRRIYSPNAWHHVELDHLFEDAQDCPLGCWLRPVHTRPRPFLLRAARA